MLELASASDLESGPGLEEIEIRQYIEGLWPLRFNPLGVEANQRSFSAHTQAPVLRSLRFRTLPTQELRDNKQLVAQSKDLVP